MGHRLVGSVLFLGVAIVLFTISGRLASEQRGGWGWFLITGWLVTSTTLTLWTAEIPKPGCSLCRKPPSPDDFG